MSRIFISYAREDREIANRIYHDLKRAGLHPWIDTEEILAGQDWKATIKGAIATSSFFLALISSRSLNKRGFVQKELRQALSLLDEFPPGVIYVIPVRLEDVEPTHARLSRLQWVDLFRSYDDALKKIGISIAEQSAGNEVETEISALVPDEVDGVDAARDARRPSLLHPSRKDTVGVVGGYPGSRRSIGVIGQSYPSTDRSWRHSPKPKEVHRPVCSEQDADEIAVGMEVSEFSLVCPKCGSSDLDMSEYFIGTLDSGPLGPIYCNKCDWYDSLLQQVGLA